MNILPLLVLLVLSQAQNNCCDLNTLTIAGAGAVEVDPDIAQFSVYASDFGTTSAIALSNVNKIINKVTTILSNKGVPVSNYSTTSINIYPQYNYTTSGITILIGQQASISLQVTIGNLVANKQIIGQIVTDISAVNNITISGLTFSNSNSDLAYRQARKSAVSDALSKASQYCSLSGRMLSSVKKIKDQNS